MHRRGIARHDGAAMAHFFRSQPMRRRHPGEGGFQCQMDSKPFVLCSSPFVRKLRKGKHKFRVRAFDDAGNPDPSLEVRSFRILRPRRR